MASFYIPLTGLESDSTALNTIANDLANLNTTGFKAQNVNFSDLFYQQIGSQGSGNLIQQGSGVATASIESQYTQGSIVGTGNATDVALSGNGFFVLNNGGTNIYTRDGNFGLDNNGNLITASGLSVMGYPAVNGVVNTNAALTAINIPEGQTEQARATTSFGMTANLDSNAAIGTAVPGSFTAYDSLGNAQVVTVTYTKTATNTWTYAVNPPAGAATTTSANTGTLVFDTSGNLTSPAAAVPGITFAGLTDGAADMTLSFNVLGTSGKPTISQDAATSAVGSTTQDGYASGQYQSFNIAADGTVEATFSNGQTQAVGRLALANVANLQGLQLLGSGDYATTLASGTASIGASGTNGLGTFQDAAVEESNVNISAEFSALIIAQRAFEANSKAVTTFDTVAQETINMVH